MAKRSRTEYKKQSLPEDKESQKVFMWRSRINYAMTNLCIPGRKNNAFLSDQYLHGQVEVPKTGKGTIQTRIYMNYTLPLLEKLHRGSIPEMPTPNVEATTEASAGADNNREETTQQFLTLMFDKQSKHIIDMIDSLQWDDDKFGVAVLRADWRQKTVVADPTSDISQENFDVQVARATEENLVPDQRVITDSDLDIAHIPTHQEFIAAMDPLDPSYEGMFQHIQEHRARLSTVNEEGVSFTRVRPDWYLYDWLDTWAKRGWEMEKKHAKVKFLIDNGYKNLNIDNAPPVTVDESGAFCGTDGDTTTLAYEDQTIAIWEIHDRLNGHEYVISADGPSDGKFLMDRPWRYGDLDIYYLDKFHSTGGDETIGEPLMHAMIPILDELAITDYFIQKHVINHPTVKVFVPDNAGADKIKRAMNDPSTKVVPTSRDMVGGVTVVQPPPIPQSLLDYQSMLKNMLSDVVGLDAQDTGASNPHKVSASESVIRANAGAGRIEDRQKIVANMLSWIGEMFLKLYRDFAMMATEVRVAGELGREWKRIEPRDLPVDIGISFDIDSATDRQRAESIAMVDRVVLMVRSSLVPHDDEKLTSWALKRFGVKRPDQFRIQGLAQGPENAIDSKGQPGIEGSSEAPVGTEENAAANAKFSPGPSDAEQASKPAGAPSAQ